MKILALIVTFRAMPWIDRCLASLMASGHPADILVIDNGSDDGTVAYIREHFPEVQLRESGANLGFGKANNIGLRYALEQGYDAVYLMNQDAWVEPSTLELLAAAAGQYPEAGIFSPMQLDAKGAPDANFAKRVLAGTPIEAGRKSGVPGPVYPVPYVMAAHWLVTRRCLETVGLFAPVFPFYGEDDNYCQRCAFHGVGVAVVPEARAVHDRADRVESKEKIIYRNYRMASLGMLCDIRRPLLRQRLKVFAYTLVKTVRYRSLLPWKHYAELRKMLPEVRLTRARTAGKGAFITD